MRKNFDNTYALLISTALRGIQFEYMKLMQCAIVLCILTFSSFNLISQDARFSVESSKDSVLNGNSFLLTYTIENLDGKFNLPDISGAKIGGNTSQSTSVQIINGEMKKSRRISVLVTPEEVGALFIPPASVQKDGEFIESADLSVQVLPNPNGIKESPGEQRYYSPFKVQPEDEEVENSPQPPMESKKLPKKRKIIKI